MILLDQQLIAFEAIVKAGTVHAAAEGLFLTQTAITHRLKLLEEKLQTTLFIRTRKGMTLTPEGKQLHRYCQQITEMGGEVLASIRGMGQVYNVRINIVGPTSIMRSRVIPQCQKLMQQFSKLYMSFVIDDGLDISPRLKSGDFEFALLPPFQISPEMQSKTLIPEEYLLVCSAKWQHRKLIDIIKNEKIIDFDKNDPMTFAYLKQYNLLKYVKTERHFVNNTESIALMFINEVGYGVLTKEFAQPYIKAQELIVVNDYQSYINPVSLAWYKRPEQPNYFAAILEAVS